MTKVDNAICVKKAKSIIVNLSLSGLFVGFVFLLVYRYCEQAGPVAQRSCVAAMIGSIAAGVAVFWPILGSFNNNDANEMIRSIFIASVTRLLLGFVVVVIILSFMAVSRGWFLGCYGIFYATLVAVDTWLIVCLFQGRSLEKDDSEYGYDCSIACKRKRSRRDYQ